MLEPSSPGVQSFLTNWRNEEREFHPDSASDCINEYNQRRSIINDNRKAIYPGEESIELFENMDIDAQAPTHIYDLLDAEGQQQREEDMIVGAENDPQYESFSYTGNLAKEDKVQLESSKYRVVNIPKENEMKVKTLRLVSEQMNVLRKVIRYCKNVVRQRKDLSHSVPPLRLIVHGGAGNDTFIRDHSNITESRKLGGW